MRPNALLASALFHTLITRITAQSSSTREGNCTVFNWDQQPAYVRYDTTPQRISAAESCPKRENITHQCAIIAEGDLQVQWKQNSTLQDSSWNGEDGVTSFFYTIIHTAVQDYLNENNVTFNNTIIGLIDSVATLEPGSAGYLNFTSLLSCFQGTFGNCTGVDDGLAVEACTPVATVDESGLAILQGNYSVQNVSEAHVGKYNDPFAGQSRGAAERSFSIRWEVIGASIVGAVGMFML
jgi:hypothetical protein